MLLQIFMHHTSFKRAHGLQGIFFRLSIKDSHRPLFSLLHYLLPSPQTIIGYIEHKILLLNFAAAAHLSQKKLQSLQGLPVTPNQQFGISRLAVYSEASGGIVNILL